MLQVTLPEELQARVQAHTQENGRDVADWITSAVENQLKQEFLEAEQRREAGLVLEAIEEEGDDIEATPQWWQDFRAELNEKYGAR